MAPFLLRISAEQRFRHDLARFPTRLIECEDLGRAYLVLAFAATLVGIALIVGLAARLAHFKQEAALR
jgi:hypothetical protein